MQQLCVRFFSSILFFLSLILLCGCSVRYQNPEEMTASSTTTQVAATKKDNSNTTEKTTESFSLPENPEQAITNTFEDILSDEEFSSMTLDSLECGVEQDTDSLYSVTLNLIWNSEIDAEIAKSLAKKRSDSISVKAANQLPYVNHLTITFTVPFLQDAKASISYKKNGSSLILKNTEFDKNFK